jgi:hypothetical protein
VEPSPYLCYDNQCAVVDGEGQVSVEIGCEETEKLRDKARAMHKAAVKPAVDESHAPAALGVVAVATALMMLIATWSGHF